MRNGIILSDPYTLGITQAITGAPAAYLFSNLDTVNGAVAKRSKSVLHAILQPAEAGNRLEKRLQLDRAPGGGDQFGDLLPDAKDRCVERIDASRPQPNADSGIGRGAVRRDGARNPGSDE